MRNSKQRDAILQVLHSCCDHPTADIIYQRVKEKIPNISLGTVYRNLGQLCSEGMIIAIGTGEDKAHYDGNAGEHIHFYCKRCGEITDFEINSGVALQLAGMGCEIHSAKIVYDGICKNCRDSI